MTEKLTSSRAVRDDHLTAAFFCAIVAIALAVHYAIAQTNQNSLFLIIQITLLSLFIQFLPEGLYALLIFFKGLKIEGGMNAPTILIALALLVLAGFISPISPINLTPVFLIISTFLSILASYRFFAISRATLLIRIAIILLAIALSSYFSVIVWRSGYLSTSYNLKLLMGRAHIDTLFHASIASMIQTYGVPATGLDGVVHLTYHAGSHWMFAQLSKLLHIDALQFYHLGFPVIFLPLFCRGMLTFGLELRNHFRVRPLYLDMRFQWIFWGLFTSCLISFVPLNFMARVGVFHTSFFSSESHNVALSIAFLTLSSFLVFFDTFSGDNETEARTSKFQGLSFVIGLVLAVLLGCITFCKVSVGFLVFCSVLYVILRFNLFLKASIFIGIIGAVALQIMCLKSMGYFGSEVAISSTSSIRLLAFPLTWVSRSMIAYWLPTLFIWPIGYLALKFYFSEIKTMRDLIKKFCQKKTLDIELIFLFCILGILPGLIIDIPGASAAYFMDFQRWFALALILGEIYHIPPDLSSQSSS